MNFIPQMMQKLLSTHHVPFRASNSFIQVRNSSVEIPQSNSWKIPTRPKNFAEFFQTVRSREFVQLATEPRKAAHMTYGAARTSYFVVQALLTARIINYRTSDGVFKDGFPSDISKLAKFVSKHMSFIFSSVLELHRRDMENVERGFYRRPYDMDPRHRQWNPLFMASNAFQFVQFSRDVVERRLRQGKTETLLKSKEAQANGYNYPDYYLQNFHYQDGWLSEFSAKSYDIATETLFFGAQDAMQRGGLIPLHYFMKGKMEKNIHLVDIACGTGRFLTFIKDNYPHMKTTAIDLSPFFLNKARVNMNYFTEFDKRVNGDRNITATEFIQAAAEKLPFESEAVDVISCVYLFHEIPPQVRKEVVKEMKRVLKKDGIIILNDSTQLCEGGYEGAFWQTRLGVGAHLCSPFLQNNVLQKVVNFSFPNGLAFIHFAFYIWIAYSLIYCIPYFTKYLR